MAEINTYLGNPNLRKAGVVYNYEPWQIEEFIKCQQDPIYFCEKYFKIVHVDLGLIPFTLYDYQKEAITSFFNDDKNLLLSMSRQSGKTSVATVIILHIALFNKNKTIGLVANKADTAREILSRIQLAYEWLPDWLKGGVKEWNKGSVEFENGSKIIAAATSGSTLRGKSLFLLYVDEHAFIENWADFAASTLPTLSSGKTTRLVFTSTPNGLNHFYYYVKSAREKKSNFKLIEVPWWKVPGRDEEWKQKILEQLDFDTLKFEQEYNLMFAGSSGTLISGRVLQDLEPVTALFENEELRVYQEPVPNQLYVLIADVSHGKGLDYSTFQIINVTAEPYVQAATYRCNSILAPDLAPVIFQAAMRYNYAYVMIELNDLGGQVADLLKFDYEYENIIGSISKGRAGKSACSTYEKGSDNGVRTTKLSKAVGCGMLKMLVEKGSLIVQDYDTINELNTFSKKGSSYEAEQGKHDDLVMPLVLFGWLFNQSYFKDLTDENPADRLRERSENDINNTLLPIGILDYGQGAEEIDEDPNWVIM